MSGLPANSNARGVASPGNECLLQIIGAGPAGIGMVLALCNRVAAADGSSAPARRLLESLRVFEADEAPGGRMADYRVNANTSARDAVLGIADGTPFTGQRDAYLAQPATADELIHLPEVGRLLVKPLARALGDYLGARLRCSTVVARVDIDERGYRSHGENGELLASSDRLLLCCGAREVPLPQLLAYRDRWEGSLRFLSRVDLDGLPGGKSPIVIIGASHSAFSCAWRLLYDPLFEAFGRDREIVILQRRENVKLRCTPEFAAEHDFHYDPETDLCPVTGLVFRNGGLRKDAKMLYLRIRDGEEKRVRLVKIDDLDRAQDWLQRSGLILQAAGFRHNAPSLRYRGREVDVGRPTQDGELRDRQSGDILPGLYGMGLGLNILPDGAPRGEASFHGGLHGFQSYPLSIAPRIIDAMIVGNKVEEAS